MEKLNDSQPLLQYISGSLSIPPNRLRRLVASAPFSYKRYTIAKRAGGRRVIHHPARRLKQVQSFLSRTILAQHSPHAAACAYVRGKGIVDAARPHLGKKYLLRMDYEDFFPSIRPEDLTPHLKGTYESSGHEIELDQETRRIIERLCFARVESDSPRLTIGAPSSPVISNMVMKEADEMFSSLSLGQSYIYTRYADDLFFSSDDLVTCKTIESRVGQITRAMKSPRLKINQNKTRVFAPGSRKVVAGLVLTEQGKLSVGANLKRGIRRQIFEFESGYADAESEDYLAGMIAFIAHVEPELGTRLSKDLSRAATRRRSKG